MNKNLGIILIIVGIVLIGVAVMFGGKPQNTEQKLVETKLNDTQLQFLIKEMNKYLTASENINENTVFTVDEMIKFAFSYTSYLDEEGKYTKIDENSGMGTANVAKIKENINLIFGVRNANLSTSSYEISGDTIYVPLNMQGGDATIYKFRQRNENKNTGVYITDIDCLEPVSADDASSLLTKTDYNEDDVIYTLQIKYKYVDGRKVLLAYSSYSNIGY